MSSGRPRAVSNMHFFVSCLIAVVNKQLFSPVSWNNLLSKINFHSLIPLQVNSSFIKHLLIGYLKTFYTDVKTIGCVKKQNVSKKDGRFQGKITQKLWASV